MFGVGLMLGLVMVYGFIVVNDIERSFGKSNF